MAHFVTFKLTISLYLLAMLLTILTSIPMLRHVLPKSECLLFVKEIEVADKTTSLQYGPPAGCLTAGLLPLFVCLAGLCLTFAHFLHLRALIRHDHDAPHIATQEWNLFVMHCVSGLLVLATVTLLTAGYSSTCANMYSVVKKDLHSLIQVDVDSDGDFDILVDVDGEYEYEEEVKQWRDEGEIQNECDGPCYKVMLKGQIEDSPTDTDSDDSWFNQPRRSGRRPPYSPAGFDWAAMLQHETRNFRVADSTVLPPRAKFTKDLDKAFVITCRSLLTDSLNHFKLMFTNVHDEEEKTEENLEEKTVTDNRLLELSLAGAWCLAILWLIVLLILLRRLRALSMFEEVQGPSKDRGGKKSKNKSKKPTSLFKRGSWVSNLNLGFRSGNSRKTSLASTTNSLTPLTLLAEDQAETRSSKNPDEERAPQLLLCRSQNQPQTFEAAQHGIQYLSQGVSKRGDNGQHKNVDKLGQARTDWLSASSNRRKRIEQFGLGYHGWPPGCESGESGELGESGGRRKGTEEVGGGHPGCPAGGETRITEEL